MHIKTQFVLWHEVWYLFHVCNNKPKKWFLVKEKNCFAYRDKGSKKVCNLHSRRRWQGEGWSGARGKMASALIPRTHSMLRRRPPIDKQPLTTSAFRRSSSGDGNCGSVVVAAAGPNHVMQVRQLGRQCVLKYHGGAFITSQLHRQMNEQNINNQLNQLFSGIKIFWYLIPAERHPLRFYAMNCWWIWKRKYY